MSSIINFFIEANICLIIFGGFYYFFLRNETDFRFNRVYLISSTLLSLIVPLFHFDNIFNRASSANIMDGMQTILLPGLTIGGDGTDNPETGLTMFSWPGLIGTTYIMVALILLTVFVYQLYDIFKFYKLRKIHSENKGDYLLIPTDGQLPTFSFFRLLFFDNSVGLTYEENSKIIEHEKVHINELHSLDIILLEFTKIIFWVNPMIWVFRNHIEDIHEYIADQKIIERTNESDYSSLLAKMALKKMSLSIGHHFNKSLTLKRITMMKKPSNRIKSWKVATLIPIMLLIVITFSCNDEVMNDIDEVMETTSQTAVPEHLKDDMARLQKENPEANFVYVEFSAESEEAFERLKYKLDEFEPNSIGTIDINKDEKRVGVIVNKNGALKKIAKSEIAADGSEVFRIVEDPALPPGGSYAAYYAKISQTLKYPEQARKIGIEGKVYVQFIIQKDGSLKDVEVVKGIGGGCDQEAVAAIAGITGWSAGKQNGIAVNQRLILPISFTLGEKSKSESEIEKVNN